MGTYNTHRDSEAQHRPEAPDQPQPRREAGNRNATTRAGAGVPTARERGVATSRESEREATRRPTPRSGAVSRAPGYGTPYAGYASPFTAMRRMMEDMDRLFENVGFSGLTDSDPLLGLTLGSGLRPATGESYAGSGAALARTPAWTPTLELFERDNTLVIRADLPGTKKDDISLDVNDGILTISGERKNELEDKREGFYRSERSYGRFSRSLALPEGVDGEQAKASFSDGVLEVTLPLPRREEKRRRIEIR